VIQFRDKPPFNGLRVLQCEVAKANGSEARELPRRKEQTILQGAQRTHVQSAGAICGRAGLGASRVMRSMKAVLHQVFQAHTNQEEAEHAYRHLPNSEHAENMAFDPQTRLNELR
jgi:hypothetical protein